MASVGSTLVHYAHGGVRRLYWRAIWLVAAGCLRAWSFATPKEVAPCTMTSILQRVQRMMCGLHGHETVLHFEPHRLSLQCLRCGHETTGWSLLPESRRRPAAVSRSRRIREWPEQAAA
jgi:hypothetical protein